MFRHVSLTLKAQPRHARQAARVRRARFKLKADTFNKATGALELHTELAIAAFLEVSDRQLRRVRLGKGLGEEFAANTVAAFRGVSPDKASRLAAEGLSPITIDTFFEVR